MMLFNVPRTEKQIKKLSKLFLDNVHNPHSISLGMVAWVFQNSELQKFFSSFVTKSRFYLEKLEDIRYIDIPQVEFPNVSEVTFSLYEMAPKCSLETFVKKNGNPCAQFSFLKNC
jgi:hypothetical protein